MGHLTYFLASWDLDPVATEVVLLTGLAYTWGIRQVARNGSGRPWARRRTAFFMTGLGLWYFVTVGPIGTYDDVFFWAHMVQHLITMMVVAPLLLLGSPVLLILQVAPRQIRHRWLVPLLRSRFTRYLSNPVLTWLLFAGTLIGTHFSPFYNYAVTHPLVHDYIEHPLYLVVALLYFYPLVGGNPLPHGPSPLTKVVSLVLQMGPESMTGFFIYTATQVMYPAYLVSSRPFGPDPLLDQQIGGALMWCSGMVIDAIWIAVAVRGWLQAEARKGRQIDRTIAAEQAREAKR